jgi:DNA-binding MarR family transcriptional regulator
VSGSAIQRHLRQTRAFRSLEEEIFVGLQIVSDRLMGPWAAYLKQHAELSPVQYNVLRILRGAGDAGLSAGDVGERLITRNPDVTRLIDRLEKRGLVERRPAADDRRAIRICITPAGIELVAQLDPKTANHFTNGLSHFSTEDLEALRDGLNSILDALDGQ